MIDDDVLERVLSNCRITVDRDEFVRMKKDLGGILEAFKIIDEADVKDLAPAYHPIEIWNIWEEDVPSPFDEMEALLSLMDVNYEGYIWGPLTRKGRK